MHSLKYYQFSVYFSISSVKKIDIYARSQFDALDILINLYPDAIAIMVSDRGAATKI